MPGDSLELVDEDLRRAYDRVLDRRETLTGQATNLTGFAGIIETVLVALLVTLATDLDARQLLASSTYFLPLKVLVAIGFFSYILATAFSLLAFRERRYGFAPTMPNRNDPVKSIIRLYGQPNPNDRQMFAVQLGEATRLNQRTNDLKYNYLNWALAFLFVGIGATALAGVTLLLLLQ